MRELKGERLEKELERLRGLWQYEDEYADLEYIAGVDEAGRGPLAGPVMAACCVLPRDAVLLYLNDSKKLSAVRRESLFQEINEKAIAFGIGVVDEKRIDEINILNATYEAMRMAVEETAGKLGRMPDILLNDAVTIPELSVAQVPIVRGDQKSASIAAASILGKVTRDRFMEAMDKEYPGYGFAKHKGYGTPQHMDALRELGPCPIHRRTFLKNIKV